MFVIRTIANAVSSMTIATISIRSAPAWRRVTFVCGEVMNCYTGSPEKLSPLMAILSVNPSAKLPVRITQHRLDSKLARSREPRQDEQHGRGAQKVPAPAVEIPMPGEAQYEELHGNERQGRTAKSP